MSANRAVLACAGARKTTELVEEAIATAPARVLLLTYTNENTEQIRGMVEGRCGIIPPHISVATWFRWLLRDCVRPYQNLVLGMSRVRSIYFDDPPQYRRIVPRTHSQRYYLFGHDIYSDRASEFAVKLNEQTAGRVVSRLEQIYDVIMLDEVQDLAGFDLDLLDLLFSSRIATVLVGDPRQAVLHTNRSRRNKKYSGAQIAAWFSERAQKGTLSLDIKDESYRSNQAICDFADRLFPTFPKTSSRNPSVTGHDGVFYVMRDAVQEYYRRYGPTVLRYSRDVDTSGLPSMNFGACKGRTYPRTLIFPTAKMLDYLRSGSLRLAGDLEKFYVAVTRAQFSVAFVVPTGFKPKD